MSLLARAIERRSNNTGPWGDSSIPTNGSLGVPSAGVVVTEQTALSILTVFSCIAILADAVSTLPLDGFTRSPSGRKELDPTPQLIEQPFAEISKQDWVSQVMVSVALRGNFYGQIIERDLLGYATQIMPLHPDQVAVKRNAEGFREYRVNSRLVPTEDILHIPGLTVPGGLVGLNPIEYNRGAFGLAKAAETYGSQFFANSAHASGVIQVEGSLEPDQTLALARSWMAAHQGLNKAQLPAVLTGGATWQSISINPDDAQFLQTREFQKMEIAGWFRVPPHMIGAVDKTTSWGTGIEQQEQGFVTNTLRPWLTRIEAALTGLLPRGQFVKFNLEGRLRADTLQRFQAYTLARNGGWMNVDDVRLKEDMPPLPDGLGQDYLQPLNFVPIGQAPPAPTPSGSTEP